MLKATEFKSRSINNSSVYRYCLILYFKHLHSYATKMIYFIIYTGESIQLKTFTRNATTLKVQPRATLYQTQIFMSGDRHRTLELVLGESVFGSEVDSNEATEDLLEIPVPARAQLTMKSAIITVKYL